MINLRLGIHSKQIPIMPTKKGENQNPRTGHLVPGSVLLFGTARGAVNLRIKKVEPGRPIFTLSGSILETRKAFQALYNPENGTGVLYTEE